MIRIIQTVLLIANIAVSLWLLVTIRKDQGRVSWYKIEDVGDSRIYYVSSDRMNWMQINRGASSQLTLPCHPGDLVLGEMVLQNGNDGKLTQARYRCSDKGDWLYDTSIEVPESKP